MELLAKFGWLNPKGPYRCLEKGKGNFCVHLLHKWVREIRNIETTAKKVQKSVMHVQSFCFANIYLLRLNGSRYRRRRSLRSKRFCSCLSFLDEPREETLATQAIVVVVAKAPYCCDPEILLPW